MSSEERLRMLLADLGKATLRGVRKCPKCGTYNGSRGLCCKNKFCDAVFKEPGEKRKLSTEACKLMTGSGVQVFSVRVRDKGPDHRGFVQLPLLNSASSSKVSPVSQNAALCFVDSCERSFDTSVLKCHEEEGSIEISMPRCQHIQAALRCYAEAHPLTLRHSILSSLNVNNETKQEIWLLATETAGPLVQRVSKNMMAVKCKATPKHPLGYLHFSFFATKSKDKIEHRYTCSCTASKWPVAKSDSPPQSCRAKRCVHFYACVCAFASNEKLSEEFQYYINLDQPDLNVQFPDDTTTALDSDAEKLVAIDLESLTSEDTHFLIFRDETLMVHNFQGNKLDMDAISLESTILSQNFVESIKVQCDNNLLEDTSIISQVNNLEVIDKNVVFDDNGAERMMENSSIKVVNDEHCLLVGDIKDLENGSVKILEANVVLDPETIKLLDNSGFIDNADTISVSVEKNPATSTNSNSSSVHQTANSAKRKRDQKSANPTSLNNLNSIEPRRTKTKPAIIKKFQSCSESIDESNANLPFVAWLASITERINQTMHFQFDGKPEPLVFHVPQIFFECLRERISCGAKKKRLPNSTTAFVRKDGVPLGTFTKYTWQITNILHVVSIFETPLIPLEITRSFLQNADGTYELYKREETDIDKYKKTMNNALIKPLELKTYLKVGNTSPNQVEPTPFLIEWIPDILPLSKIGELRIRFEFGHIKNETPQRWRKLAALRN